MYHIRTEASQSKISRVLSRVSTGIDRDDNQQESHHSKRVQEGLNTWVRGGGLREMPCQYVPRRMEMKKK